MKLKIPSEDRIFNMDPTGLVAKPFGPPSRPFPKFSFLVCRLEECISKTIHAFWLLIMLNIAPNRRESKDNKLLLILLDLNYVFQFYHSNHR